MAQVAAFKISRFNTVTERLQKPFNPLLGETYEMVTSKYRSIVEQVSHHPPITAYHIEGNCYEVFSHSLTTTRFNGRNVITQPPNRVYVVLKLPDGTKEVYSANQPVLSAHNLIIGKLYIDLHGKT